MLEELIPTSERIVDVPMDDGWVERSIHRTYDADWETGVRYFRSFGYRNTLTLPNEIIPMQFGIERVIHIHPNAVVIVKWAEASTYNQPKDWTGDVQLDPDKRQNVWREDSVQLVKMMS